uniref:Glomulin, FKBP associated protein b n=1 Tax=Echeneis naucrates TaxID=173247 RepID=A0A665WAH4_ECHNA
MKGDQVKDTFQRWRDTREEDLNPEDYQLFRDLGSACLARGDSAQLLEFVQDEKNQGIVKCMGCVIMAPLVDEVVKKVTSAEPCQAAIVYLTRTCRSEELLHGLLELIEDINPGDISQTIIVLVPHFKTVLLRMEDRKATSVGLVLAALQKQMQRLPVPYTPQQEEADEYGLCRCCIALLQFTKCFVEEVKRKHGKSVTTTEDEELRTELLKFCMRSLREPLLEVELSHNRKSYLWLFATEIMVTLSTIQVSLSELLFFYNSLKKSTAMDNSQSMESRASLAYLLFVQLITIDSFPAVFSPIFVLQCNMEYVSELLSRYTALNAKSLESVQDHSLPVNLMELKSFYSVPQKLRQVLTECPMKHLRESALQVFQLFVNKLDTEAKHKFFRCMLKVSNHAGVESYIIKNIKNHLEFSMESGNANKWFLGEEFLSLLGLVLHLPHGAETDLLNSMDRIMESLNLLRYLLIRDKNLDVWEELGRMKDEYLKMLRVCLSISRAYYSAELKALKEDQKLKAKGRIVQLILLSDKVEVSDMSPEVQHQVLQSALVTFDLMESLIVRIEEITEEKLKIPN